MAHLISQRTPQIVVERDREARLPPARVARVRSDEHVWSPADDRLIDLARNESREHRKEYIGTKHVLLAFLTDKTSEPAQMLPLHGVQYEQIREELIRLENVLPGGDGSQVE